MSTTGHTNSQIVLVYNPSTQICGYDNIFNTIGVTNCFINNQLYIMFTSTNTKNQSVCQCILLVCPIYNTYLLHINSHAEIKSHLKNILFNAIKDQIRYLTRDDLLIKSFMNLYTKFNKTQSVYLHKILYGEDKQISVQIQFSH
jgi:hypothetical protein